MEFAHDRPVNEPINFGINGLIKEKPSKIERKVTCYSTQYFSSEICDGQAFTHCRPLLTDSLTDRLHHWPNHIPSITSFARPSVHHWLAY